MFVIWEYLGDASPRKPAGNGFFKSRYFSSWHPGPHTHTHSRIMPASLFCTLHANEKLGSFVCECDCRLSNNKTPRPSKNRASRRAQSRVGIQGFGGLSMLCSTLPGCLRCNSAGESLIFARRASTKQGLVILVLPNDSRILSGMLCLSFS